MISSQKELTKQELQNNFLHVAIRGNTISKVVNMGIIRFFLNRWSVACGCMSHRLEHAAEMIIQTVQHQQVLGAQFDQIN